MCAGKNLAAAILEKRGFLVVDADKTAHQALEDMKEEVIAEFSEVARERCINLVLDDGRVNRRALGQILFSDPALLVRHEDIIYPRINFLLGRFIDEHPDQTVVINAPLLYKSPILDRCDFVIFVDACSPVRFFRSLKRDKMHPFQVFARFSAQKNLFAQYLLKYVDIQRVLNKGSIRALEKGLAKLLSNRGY